MKKTRKSRSAAKGNKQGKPWLISMIRGCLIAMIATLAGILAFALVLKLGLLNETAIPVVNQVLKILGIALCALITVRALQEKAWLFGALSGAVYILLCFALFSLVEGSLRPTSLLITDVGMGLIAGAIVASLTRLTKRS